MPSKLEILVNIAITSLIMAASNFSTIGSQIQSIANSGFSQEIIESPSVIKCPDQPPTNLTRE
ncbi:hypothetical protein J0895_11080 [Phormidium pseudopriestleyi FRX01]|uniref:Uncharacterized protein n=1 Tax=Phormidium pseudopriestleyi FRX01 TaxID=1759528 RepID=A0ABS3FRM9_9CYAN|nr:hypothetical protein [Phormidium pseudopriestleyi]MBO0349644.1 hypothetical protein [Phormidium pseudopriestleyi FRX01]